MASQTLFEVEFRLNLSDFYFKGLSFDYIKVHHFHKIMSNTCHIC